MTLNANALVTVAQAKSHLGIASSNVLEDARIETFINASSDRIERYCDRKFASQTHTEYHHGRRQNIIMPRQWPITAVSEIRISGMRDWTSSETLLAADGYFISDSDQTITYDYAFPDGFNNIRVIYTAGYSTMPADLQLACLWYVEWYFRHRERGDIGRTSASKGDESIGVLASAPPMIAEILNDYKRSEFPNANVPVKNL